MFTTSSVCWKDLRKASGETGGFGRGEETCRALVVILSQDFFY